MNIFYRFWEQLAYARDKIYILLWQESGMVEEIVLDVDNDMDELDFEADEPEA